MCIFDSPTATSSGTSTTTPDPLTQSIRQAILPYAFGIANQSFPGFDSSQRVAPFNPTQVSAFSKVGDLASNPSPGYYNFADANARSVAGAAPGSVSTGRVVDEGHGLGSIMDYMSPYIQQTLDPQIREIGKTAQRQRNATGDRATFAGAYGDARHGVSEGMIDQGEQQAVGDVTGQAWQAAFNQAMGLRTNDQANFLGADTLNQNLREQGFGRQLQGATSAMDFGTANNVDYLQRLNAMLNTGQSQQQNTQSGLDAQYQNYQQGVEWPFRQFDVLKSLLTGQPSAGTTQSSGSSNPNTGTGDLLGGLGSILGAFLPSLFGA